MPDSSDILARRIAAEAQRQGTSEEVCRERILERGLEALAQDRRRLEEIERLRADVVLVTATATEREELLRELAARSPNVDKIRGSQFRYRRALIGNWQVAAIHVEMGVFGEGGALECCQVALDETLAVLFVAVGTAFGIPEVAGLGDVLLSDAVLFYDERRVAEFDGTVTEIAHGKPRRASSAWVARVREVAARRVIPGPRLVEGTLLSGGAIIESPTYRDQLVRWHEPNAPSRIVGGEMEAAALVHVAGDRDWLLVKGVSDMADGATRLDEEALRERQRVASRNAAIVILETLARIEREVG